MSEPHVSPSSPMPTSAQALVLATKTGIPRLRHDLLRRPHLLDRLDAAMTQALVLISTPAGWGKTTLLAAWARSTMVPTAWLSVDDADNDPARFWRHLLAALDTMHGGIDEQLHALLDAPEPPTGDAVVAALVNALTAYPSNVVLILDDYHLITSRAIHDSLTLLVEHLPAGLHVVLASRTDPPLPLARWRARNQLAELRAGDVQLTYAESSALLQDVWQLALPADDLATLIARTDGWVTGLQLAALSLRTTPDRAQCIRRFGGSHLTSWITSATRWSNACLPRCSDSCWTHPYSIACMVRSATH